MRSFLIIFLGAIPIFSFGQIANRAVLTLVDEAGANEVDIDLDVSNIGSSNDTSDLSGTIEVQLNISPVTATTDEMTILSADVNGTDVTLDAGGFLANYSFQSKNLGFTAFTPQAPGIVNPSNGEFDASQHELTANRGTLEGEAYTLLTGSLDIPDFNFATDNFVGNGEGTGSVAITPGRIEGRKLYFNVTLEFPALIEQPIESEDLPVDANVKIEGTLKAVGETFIEFPDYTDWASEVGVGATSRNEFDLSPNTPNGILFSLGFDETNSPDQLFDFSSAGATLKIGQDVALGAVEIQWSDDLITWTRVPRADMTSGSSVISFGDPLTEATVVGPDGTRKYLRVRDF